MVWTALVLIFSFMNILWVLALSPLEPASTRRQVLKSLLVSTSSTSVLFGDPAFSKAEEETTDISLLLGRYTDPINHPGGFRTVDILLTNDRPAISMKE